ncbi:unnamed protein product, partial [Hapterophycus canaliculatus]
SSSSNDRWSRWYTFPKISLNEMTIGSQQNLVLGPGTSSISSSLDAANSADSAQPTATLLVPTVIVNGIGWIAAILLLGLARLVGRRGLTTIGVGVMLAMIAGVLWPTSIAAMVALVALPLTIAALQISASGRN